MSWVRIDDHAPEHPKLLKAGPVAGWLWVCGLAYCSRHLTDGQIPAEAVPTMGVPKAQDAVARLLAVGLWEETDTGYQVHDYHGYQPSKSQVSTRRQRTLDRVTEWRKKNGYAHGNAAVTLPVTPEKPESTHPPVPVPDPDPDPVPQEPEDPPTPNDPTLAFRDAWDTHPHAPKVQEWTEPRCEAIRRALKAKRDLMGIFSAFDRSGFLCGTRPRSEGHESFRATVDWCLKPANLIKILEGAYADPAPGRLARLRAEASTMPTADAYGWCDHEPRCGTRGGHDLRLSREQRESIEEQPA